jgi:hypothetical protein
MQLILVPLGRKYLQRSYITVEEMSSKVSTFKALFRISFALRCYQHNVGNKS